MIFDYDKSYWNSKGKYNTVSEKLQELIPMAGEVENPKKNPKLERFRRAVNVYYDLYNNGLGNRGREFRHVYGFGVSNFKRGFCDYSDQLHKLVEEELDRIVVDAAIEQGLAKIVIQEG